MKKVELLAPAKNLETGIAAINSGADAIYIGANHFGARINAGNSLDDIKKLVEYAHKFYVRIHVTINTILNNQELKNAIELVKNLYNIGVDAIIVQDMGLINAAIKNEIPPIQIHISTQCHTSTLEKAKFFDDLGITRIVLARELSINQIKEICSNTKCEIETFIHGALCVSYSGQCYMSYYKGCRSANRGECAQPCREKYSLIDEDGKYLIKNKHLLNLKDFNATNSIQQLIDCGVNSFKIEGRLKDINYVKNVVLHYNNELNKYTARTSSGKVFTDFMPNINKTFNRNYTEYFLQKRENCFNFDSPKFTGEYIGKITKVGNDYIEIDSNTGINAQDGIYFEVNGKENGFLVNKATKNIIYPNNMEYLKIGTTLYRNFDSNFEKEINSAKILRKIGISISIENQNIKVTDEDDNTVKINIPKGEIPKAPEKNIQNYIKQLNKLGDSEYYIKKLEIIDKNLPFLPISKLNNLRRELLKLLTKERIKNYPKIPQKPICYATYPDKNIDYKGNIFNSEAEDFYKKCKVETIKYAFEYSKNNQKNVELMRTKHCLKYAINLCKKNTKKLYLEDRKGKKYPLEFDCKKCEMVILKPEK